jgi:uncharacterized protein YdaU (DUF1376 family)
MNAQGRDAPAYQEYPAAMLTKLPFRRATFAQRGLLFTLRLELWVNEALPADPDALAAILGVDPTEVANALPAIMSFFAIENGELRCPELDAYRAHLDARHLKQSEGGKHGAAITNAEKKKRRRLKNGAASGIPADATTPTSTSSATPSGTPPASGRVLSTVQPSQEQHSQALSTGSDSSDPWVADFEAGTVKAHISEAAEAYIKASRG